MSKNALAFFMILSVLLMTYVSTTPVATSAASPSNPSSTATWDFRSVDTDGSGFYEDGTWSWINATRTLILTNFSFTTSAATALWLPYDSTIVLNGSNNIKSIYEGTGFTYGIYYGASDAFLRITGSGSLNVTGGNSTGASSFGISVNILLINDSVSVMGYGGLGLNSVGIMARYFAINDNASVMVYGGNNATDVSAGVIVGTLNINNNASLSAAGQTAPASYGIYRGSYVNPSISVYGGSFAALGQTRAIDFNYIIPSGCEYWVNTTTTNPEGAGNIGISDFVVNSTYKYVRVGASFPVTILSAGTNYYGSGTYAHGTSVFVSAGTAPSGMQFKEWTSPTEITFTNKNSANTTFTMPSNDVVLTAVFEVSTQPNTYTITYNLNGGTGTAPTETPKIAGAAFTVASASGLIAPTGQRFKEWNTAANGNGTSYNAGTTVTMPANNLTFYAMWENITHGSYTITNDANQTWKKGSTTGVTIICDGDLFKFSSVKVDDILIAASNYDKVEGSTIITLKTAYLETLSIEVHIVKLAYDDGSAQMNLTVLSADKTSSNSARIWIIAAILVCVMSVSLIWFFMAHKKR